MDRALRVLHMGDSITSGQFVDPKIRWTALIEEKLRVAFGPGVTESIHSGVPGDTSRMGLERFPTDVQDHEPDLVTLQFGMNDCNCWRSDRGLPRVSEAAFKANLTEMIERCRTFGVRHLILATNPRSLRRGVVPPSAEPFEEANARYSELTREVAAETGIELCDVRKGFEPVGDARLVELLQGPPDLLHLSATGNDFYANLLWPSVLSAVAGLLGVAAPALPASPNTQAL